MSADARCEAVWSSPNESEGTVRCERWAGHDGPHGVPCRYCGKPVYQTHQVPPPLIGPDLVKGRE